MTKSVVIICDDSPIGKNSVIEAMRMGAGIMAIGDLDECKIIFMGDSVYILNKSLNPQRINMDRLDNIFHMLELSEVEVYALDTALKNAGLNANDIIKIDNINIATLRDISEFILKADVTYKF